MLKGFVSNWENGAIYYDNVKVSAYGNIDLSFHTGLAFVPNPPVEGNSFQIKATIDNTGTLDAGRFRIDYYVIRASDQDIVATKEDYVSGLDANRSVISDVSIGSLPAGNYIARVVINSNNEINESNINNNTKESNFTIQPLPTNTPTFTPTFTPTRTKRPTYTPTHTPTMTYTPSETPTTTTPEGNLLFQEDWDSYNVGTYLGDINGWIPKYNATNSAGEWYVDNSNFVSTSNSARVRGTAGGTWEGQLYYPIPYVTRRANLTHPESPSLTRL